MTELKIEISQQDQRKHDLELIARSSLIASMQALDTRLSYDACLEPARLFLQKIEIMQEVREFHSLEFVCSCLKYVEEVSHLLNNKHLIVAALLFYTSGYVPGDKRSVERSLRHAQDYYSLDVCEKLAQFIEVAQADSFDEIQCKDSDFLYLRDILNYPYGLEWEDFRKIWGKVLLEFKSVGKGPLVFKRFTASKLNNLLARSQGSGIYRTSFFKLKCESLAIENIKRILGELTSS